MDRCLVLGAALACACNAHLGDTPGDAGKQPDGAKPGDARAADGPPDALPAWSMPQAVTGAAAMGQNIDDDTLSSTQTEMYFAIVDATLGVKQLWMMSRANAAAAWGTPAKLDTTFNVGGTTPPQEESPRLSPDDKTIYFGRGGDIYYATRTAVGAPWTTPQILSSVSTGNYEKWFALCDSNYYMVARDSGANTPTHLYVGQIGSGDTLASELAGTTGNDISSFLTADCLTTYFASSRSGQTQIYTATRTSPTASFTSPTLVTDFGTAPDNEDPWLSPDGLAFYFASERFGGTNTNKGVYGSTR